MRTIVEQAVVAGIRGSDLKELFVPCPPKIEQDTIANLADTLDAKIDLLQRQNHTLEQIAQTLFKRWFVEFEFPTIVNSEERITNNEKRKMKNEKLFTNHYSLFTGYKSSGGPMVASELGEIPEGWQVGKIGDAVEIMGGGTPSTKEPSYWENGDIIWYSPTDLTRDKTLFSLGSAKRITELGLQKSSAKLFPVYSLLMTSRATVGEITINTKEASTNQGFITIIPNNNFPVWYLHGWLTQQIPQVKNLASGSTFPEISKSVFRNLEIIIPRPEIMTSFVDVAEPVYKKIETNINQIQTLTRLRDTLLPKLMSGQLRVNSE